MPCSIDTKHLARMLLGYSYVITQLQAEYLFKGENPFTFPPELMEKIEVMATSFSAEVLIMLEASGVLIPLEVMEFFETVILKEKARQNG